MFKDKIGKLAKNVKEKTNATIQSSAATEMKETFSAFGKEALVGGVQESVKAKIAGQDAIEAFQNHVLNWKNDYTAQKIQEVANEFDRVYEESTNEND